MRKVFKNVLPISNSQVIFVGTWRTTLVSDAKHFMKISGSIPVEMAATMSINPPTAYRMLKSFITLKPGTNTVILEPRT